MSNLYSEFIDHEIDFIKNFEHLLSCIEKDNRENLYPHIGVNEKITDFEREDCLRSSLDKMLCKIEIIIILSGNSSSYMERAIFIKNKIEKLIEIFPTERSLSDIYDSEEDKQKFCCLIRECLSEWYEQKLQHIRKNAPSEFVKEYSDISN